MSQGRQPRFERDACIVANRETRLAEITIRNSTDDPLIKATYKKISKDHFQEDESELPLWEVCFRYLTGLDTTTKRVMLFHSDETRAQIEERIREKPPSDEDFGSHLFSMGIERGFPTQDFSIDPDSFNSDCYEILFSAGVKTRSYDASQTVLEWVGAEECDILREKFEGNWQTVAELKYSIEHFPPSSLAQLAARLRTHSQKMTMAASAIADRKTVGLLS